MSLFDKKVRMTSPKGVAIWPSLHAPDTRFKEDGEYKTNLRIAPGPDADKLEDRLQELFDGSKAAMQAENPGKTIEMSKHLPFAREEDGSLVIKTKARAGGISRKSGKAWTFRPAQFDGQNNPVPRGTKVGSGSIMRVNFEVSPYWTSMIGCGITLRLNAVQILKLVQFGADPEAMGFETEEDSFDASATEFDVAEETKDEFEAAEETKTDAPSGTGPDF